MIIQILKNSHIGVNEKYVIEFMLDTLGYFYNWISEEDIIPQSKTVLCYQPPDTERAENSNYIYLPKTVTLKTLHKTTVNWQEKEINNIIIPLLGISSKLGINDKTTKINFDLIANIYYHLARIEEAPFVHPDQIDENVENAVLFQYGHFKRPVVDILLTWFDKILQNKLLLSNSFILKRCAYPRGESFGVAITHDVDFISAYHPLKKKLLEILYKLKISKSPTPQEMNKADNKIWGFDAILDFYKKTDWKGAFFFIARYQEGRHFRYRLRTKKIRQIFKILNQNGHEIAFHPSRYAFEHSSRYKRELKRLKYLSNYPVSGMRHHYLRCLYPDIWLKAEELGLSYDAGLSYRRHSGFRAGTTRPFPTFAHTQNRELNIWEFSTAIFETTTGKETKKIRSIIETIKQNEGLLTLIWHTNNFYPEYKLFAVWQKIIEILKEHYIFITSLKEHLKWQQQRKNISILKIMKSGNQTKVIFDIPGKLDSFSLQIISFGKTVKVSSSHLPSLKEIDDKVIITNDKQSDNIELDFHQ